MQASTVITHALLCGALGTLSAASVVPDLAPIGFGFGAIIGAITSPVMIWAIRDKDQSAAMALIYAGMVGAMALFERWPPEVHVLVLFIVLIVSGVVVHAFMPMRTSSDVCGACGHPLVESTPLRCLECGLCEVEQHAWRKRRWLALFATLASVPLVLWIAAEVLY